MARESLETLYKEQLKDLYSAEQQILKALPKMSKKATHPELRQAFQEHEQVTRQQAQRLERIIADLGEKPGGHTCKAMQGIIAEGEEVMEEHSDSDVLDAAMIGAAQRVEHYEIAGYGTARTYASMLGLDDHAKTLQTTLDEEGATDEKLSRIAEVVVNIDAMKD